MIRFAFLRVSVERGLAVCYACCMSSPRSATSHHVQGMENTAMEKIEMHESLTGVIDNGDGTFTISRDKLIDLVQG